MHESMLGRIVRLVVTVPPAWLGTLVDLLEKLLGKEGGQNWFTALRRFLRKEEAWVGRKFLLRFLSTMEVRVGGRGFGEPGEFSVADAFRLNADVGQRVRIIYLGENFNRQFLTKVEENMEDATLCEHELLEPSRDISIVAELGNEEGVEILLAHFYEVLAAKQAANDYTLTVGYARDKDGNLCPIFAGWDKFGWYVEAKPLGNLNGWGRGHRFLSRPRKS